MLITASVFMLNDCASERLILKDGDTGRTIASFPVQENDEFSITFIHSVNKSPVTDVYQIRNGEIYVIRTVYYSFGAGVQTEISEGQSLTYGEDGSMTISGFDLPMNHLSYIVGTVSDHTLQIDGTIISLRELCGRNATVRILYKKGFLF